MYLTRLFPLPLVLSLFYVLSLPIALGSVVNPIFPVTNALRDMYLVGLLLVSLLLSLFHVLSITIALGSGIKLYSPPTECPS